MSSKDNYNNDQHPGGSGEMVSNKKECTSCDQNVDNFNFTKDFNSVSILDNMSMCANCGKGEEESSKLKKCVACKLVKYCSRECQATHRPQHKKACKKRAAELYDEKLFTEVEPKECPLCFLLLPYESNTSSFMSCCGKVICIGCVYSMNKGRAKGKNQICAFCRTPDASTAKDHIKRMRKLMDNGNAFAFYNLGTCYSVGSRGVPQNYQKASEMWLKAGELGCAAGYNNLGVLYEDGMGVEVDKQKAKHYYELAAMAGDVNARHSLGRVEALEAGNYQRAHKHLIIAAKAGDNIALGIVKKGFMKGFISKDEYAVPITRGRKKRGVI